MYFLQAVPIPVTNKASDRYFIIEFIIQKLLLV